MTYQTNKLDSSDARQIDRQFRAALSQFQRLGRFGKSSIVFYGALTISNAAIITYGSSLFVRDIGQKLSECGEKIGLADFAVLPFAALNALLMCYSVRRTRAVLRGDLTLD
jgi:hypothetical protein